VKKSQRHDSAKREDSTATRSQDRTNKTNNKLTTDQQKALSKLKSFVQGSHSFFRLSGYAGTGKSYTICHFMEWLVSSEVKFVAAAPTNKAAKNLKQIAVSIGIGVDVLTVAQLLGQQPEIDEDTGLEEFVGSGEAKFDKYDLVIIDEFSMINRANFEEIIEAVALTIDTKVIFVGDAAQLPPVKETESIIAVSDYIELQASLTEIVRHDGEIAIVAEEIRNNNQYNSTVYPFKNSEDETIVCLPRAQWLETVTAYFESDNYKANPDYVRLLVWKNKTALSANKFVRSRLWGKEAPLYVPGDRLIARKPLFRPRPGKKGKNKWGVLINNSEECSVMGTGILEELVFDHEVYQYWLVPIETDSGLDVPLSMLSVKGQELQSERLKYYAEKKQWNRYYDLSRMFDDVTYAYGLTVHKAQGSSIDYVFLDTEDMRYCPDLQKMLYTALTRTKVKAFIPL
jgi:AAA domain/UvrD-like helicase C-terminal domain